MKLLSVDPEEQRNFIQYAALGDKPYQAVEYSQDFYETYGSTVAVPHFGYAMLICEVQKLLI